MRYISFLTMFFLQLSTTALSAATFEINIAEFFPQQNLIKTVQIEAASLQTQMTLTDGQIIDSLPSQWPPISEITTISVKGPEVQFKVITQSGSEWTRSLGSFDLKLSNTVNVNEGRKEMVLDLHATPLHKIFEQKNPESPLSFSHYLFKTLMLSSKGNIHFYLIAATDFKENTHPSLKMVFELDKQNLTVELLDQPDGLKTGTWKISGNGLGKNSLVDLVLSAIRAMSDECKKIPAPTEYDQILKNIFYGIDLFLDFTAPISEWTGITVTETGSFDYISNDTGIFSTHLNNHILLEAYDGSWNISLGSKSYLSFDMTDAPTWSQEFIVKNPERDLKKAAEWIQLHWVDQLSALLDMPSLKYYANYFPKYFISGLTLVMSSLGEMQEDGTVSFKLNNNSSGSFTLAGLSPSEIAYLIIAKIKERSGW